MRGTPSKEIITPQGDVAQRRGDWRDKRPICGDVQLIPKSLRLCLNDMAPNRRRHGFLLQRNAGLDSFRLAISGEGREAAGVDMRRDEEEHLSVKLKRGGKHAVKLPHAVNELKEDVTPMRYRTNHALSI